MCPAPTQAVSNQLTPPTVAGGWNVRLPKWLTKAARADFSNPDSSEKSLKRISSLFQRYGVPAGALLSIPVGVLARKVIDGEVTVEDVVNLTAFGITTAFIQELSWRAAGMSEKLVQKMSDNADPRMLENRKGIAAKLMALGFWVVVFPLIEVSFDKFLSKVADFFKGNQGSGNDDFQSRQKDLTREQDPPPGWLIPSLLGGLGSLGAGAYGLKAMSKGMKGTNAAKINQLLLEFEPFVFIPVNWTISLLSRLFVYDQGWSQALESSKFLGAMLGTALASHAAITFGLNRRWLAPRLQRANFFDHAGNPLDNLSKSARENPEDVSNLGFSWLNGFLKDGLMVPVLGTAVASLIQNQDDSQQEEKKALARPGVRGLQSNASEQDGVGV
jgi:hypothetical protein